MAELRTVKAVVEAVGGTGWGKVARTAKKVHVKPQAVSLWLKQNRLPDRQRDPLADAVYPDTIARALFFSGIAPTRLDNGVDQIRDLMTKSRELTRGLKNLHRQVRGC